MNRHDQKVQLIADQIKQRFLSDAPIGERPLVFVKKSVSHVVPNPYEKDDSPRIDLSPLSEILEIDVEGRTCTVESGVTFTQVVRELLQRGLQPYVVPELETITLGGAVSGCSIESQSYRLGGFHDSCIEYEVINGKGEIIHCSRDEHPEIFESVHGGYGTLGIITKIKFKIMPAKPYVRIENVHFSNFNDFWAALKDHVEKCDYPYVDGIIHDKSNFVLCLGRGVDYAPFLSRYDGTEIYYKSTLKKSEDYIETSHYFLRYDGECHWMTKTIPGLENPLIRRVFGKIFIGSSKLITLSNKLKPILRKIKRRPDVVVDVFIPQINFEKFYNWYESEFDFYPLWIVPYRMPEKPYMWLSDQRQETFGTDLIIDAAVYGKPNCEPDRDWSEVLEHKVAELSGFKTLISRNHYTVEEFWETFSKERIESVKSMMDPRNLFGTIYDRMVLKK